VRGDRSGRRARRDWASTVATDGGIGGVPSERDRRSGDRCRRCETSESTKNLLPEQPRTPIAVEDETPASVARGTEGDGARRRSRGQERPEDSGGIWPQRFRKRIGDWGGPRQPGDADRADPIGGRARRPKSDDRKRPRGGRIGRRWGTSERVLERLRATVAPHRGSDLGDRGPGHGRGLTRMAGRPRSKSDRVGSDAGMPVGIVGANRRCDHRRDGAA
jgi:hypothetical protein